MIHNNAHCLKFKVFLMWLSWFKLTYIVSIMKMQATASAGIAPHSKSYFN